MPTHARAPPLAAAAVGRPAGAVQQSQLLGRTIATVVSNRYNLSLGSDPLAPLGAL